jgi:glutamate synthase domain-containing protein 2/Na+-translocating ferredoxin:NAD+ oxidoreductase RNF subunit RnfB
MSNKYHINTDPAPGRFLSVPKYLQLETEGCLGCLKCVKRTSCVYSVIEKKAFDPAQIIDRADTECVGCLQCVQECKKNILGRAKNPRFERMGDDYWTPEIIAGIWKQAATGKIPVSGAGYRGPFSGPGFDRMWTDMSEIVRPTRDGINGREYISTIIELGRKPARLVFDADGRMETVPPPFIELPIPIVFEVPDFAHVSAVTIEALARAAGAAGTLLLVDAKSSLNIPADLKKNLMIRFDPDRDKPAMLRDVPAVQITYSATTLKEISRLKDILPELVISVRLPIDENAVKRVSRLAAGGAEIIHLYADSKGRGFGRKKADFLTSLIKEMHFRLVDEGVRDELALLFSGGIAMAEHMVKAMLCGADGVGVDTALLVALECRLCRECKNDTACPVDIENAPVEWAEKRIVNLIGAWHSQLIEMMGAMGLREARRLRGELGRAMFFRDLERDNFGPLFGERVKEGGDHPLELHKIPAPSHGNGHLDTRGGIHMEVQPCLSRYRNQFGKYKVVRTSACTACGKCAEVCAYGVHVQAGSRMLAPKSYKCRGREHCRSLGRYCVDKCREKAIKVGRDPLFDTIGDYRWTSDLILATWRQAETGRPPEEGIEYRTGGSGGGFDCIDFIFPEQIPDRSLRPESVDLSIPLNRRKDGRPEVTIGMPMYGGGMSFGSVSLTTMVARARAYTAFNSFTCSGEGGYPDGLKKYDDHVITQVATGLFGVREETIQRVRMVEFKYAQGAKPGLGGHLLGDKVTPAVAQMREAVVGSSLFSPFPFHSVYSVEDHKKHVDWIKVVNSRALVSVKVSTPSDVDMVAVGSYCAEAHVIHLDGSYGGTGAAPDIAKKNIAMPIEYAIPKVHRFLVDEGIRSQVTLIVSGGLRTAWDVAKAIALGADGVVVGTAEMVALECIRCANCESGRGCPRGIATTDPELCNMYDEDWAAQRLMNLFHSWSLQLQDILWRLGMKSVRELVGRSDLLRHLNYEKREEYDRAEYHRVESG